MAFPYHTQLELEVDVSSRCIHGVARLQYEDGATRLRFSNRGYEIVAVEIDDVAAEYTQAAVIPGGDDDHEQTSLESGNVQVLLPDSRSASSPRLVVTVRFRVPVNNPYTTWSHSIYVLNRLILLRCTVTVSDDVMTQSVAVPCCKGYSRCSRLCDRVFRVVGEA